jgi:hypothetical protein
MAEKNVCGVLRDIFLHPVYFSCSAMGEAAPLGETCFKRRRAAFASLKDES